MHNSWVQAGVPRSLPVKKVVTGSWHCTSCPPRRHDFWIPCCFLVELRECGDWHPETSSWNVMILLLKQPAIATDLKKGGWKTILAVWDAEREVIFGGCKGCRRTIHCSNYTSRRWMICIVYALHIGVMKNTRTSGEPDSQFFTRFMMFFFDRGSSSHDRSSSSVKCWRNFVFFNCPLCICIFNSNFVFKEAWFQNISTWLTLNLINFWNTALAIRCGFFWVGKNALSMVQ